MHKANVFTVEPRRPTRTTRRATGPGRSSSRPSSARKEIGGSIYDLPPGESICPYHFEYGTRGVAHRAAGPADRAAPPSGDGEVEEALEPGDTVCFPRGPSGAHKVTNTTDEPVRVLMLSTMPEVDISYYPDSEKFGVWPAAGEGFLVRRASGVEYYDGE